MKTLTGPASCTLCRIANIHAAPVCFDCQDAKKTPAASAPRNPWIMPLGEITVHEIGFEPDTFELTDAGRAHVAGK